MSDQAHTVILADDHDLVRAGVAGLIDRVGGYRVVCEAPNGKELIAALELIEEPRIAVVDLHMPVMDGFETISWFRVNRPHIMTLALTVDPSEEIVLKALRAGARGFLRKNARAAVLKTALDSLILSGYYHSEEVHDTLVRLTGLKTDHERTREDVDRALTARERQFLVLVCDPEEFTYEQIADHMEVHRRTVDSYRESIGEKFGVKSKTGLVLFAMKWGIVKP